MTTTATTTTSAPAASALPAPAQARATRTPSLLRLGAAAVAALAVVAAIAVALTTAGRTAAVGRLADSTAAVSTATGDADAGFAQADAAAASLAVAPDAATELRYLQGLATGTNQLERAARLTRLGEVAEAPIRRALRSVEAYSADITRARDAAAAGAPVPATAVRARATMTNLIRANAERAGVAHDDAVRTDRASLRDGTVATVALTLVPLVALAALLVVLQVLLARRFRRLINIPLVLATLLLVAVGVRTTQLQLRQSDRVSAAVEGPYEASRLLTDARVKAFEADGERRSTGVVSKTADAAFTDALSAAAAALGPEGNALGDAVTGYRDAVARSGATADTGQPGGPTSRFNVLDAALLTERAKAGDAFQSTIDDARAGQTTHASLAPIALALVAALAALGLQRRLAEYR